MITLTEKAVAEVKRLAAAQGMPEAPLRVGVRGGGCSGLAYFLEFDTDVGPHDRLFEFEGQRVVVDPKSYLYLNGTTLDFTVSGLRAGFVFHNPNAQASCGCGSSFTV